MTTAVTVRQIAQDVRQHVVQWFLNGDEAAAFQDAQDLHPILSSLRVLSLVLHLERNYGFKIETSDVTPENFGSIDKITAYVARRMAELERGPLEKA